MSSQGESTDYSSDEISGPYVSTIQFAIQDMAHMYAPKFTKTHTLDTPIPTSQIHVHELLNGKTYMPIQNLPPLCDDPTSPWFYINDCRPEYPNQPYYSIVPQLIIRGTPYYSLNSLTPNKYGVRNSARDLAEFYMDKESVYGIATALLAKLYMNAIAQAHTIRDIIQSTTATILRCKKHSAIPTDFGTQLPEFSCYTIIYRRMEENLRTLFVGLKPYSDLSIAKGIKDPLYLLDWDEYDNFSLGGSPFDSYLCKDYELTDLSTACDIMSRTYNDMFEMLPHVSHTCETNNKMLYRQSTGFSLDCFATIPHADYIIVRPIQNNGTKLSAEPLIIKPIGQWYTVYELLISFAESLMLRDSDFQGDFSRKASQKFDSVKEKFEQKSVGDSSGKCSVCAGEEFDSYIEHISSSNHLKNYQKELNKLFRPTFLETEADKGLIKLDGSDSHALVHRSLTCLEYIKHVSKHMERKNTALAQLSYLANCIATRENVDYSLACDAITRSCYSMGLPIILDSGDKPVRASSPTLTSNESVRTWLTTVRYARADEFEEVDVTRSRVESEERYTIEAQILYALAAMLEKTGGESLSFLNPDLPNMLANENRANRRHLMDIFISADDVRRAYSSASPLRRAGFCNLISIFGMDRHEATSNTMEPIKSVVMEPKQSEAPDKLCLSQIDVATLASEFKDYEVGIYTFDGIMSRIAKFTKSALEADPLFDTDLMCKQNMTMLHESNKENTTVSQLEGASNALKPILDPPEITLPNMRRSIFAGKTLGQTDIDLVEKDFNANIPSLLTDLQEYPTAIYQDLIEEVDRYLELHDNDSLCAVSQLHSTSFGGFENLSDEDYLYQDDLVFSNSFDMGSGVVKDCYSMHMLRADMEGYLCIDSMLCENFSSQTFAVYSAIIPAQIGPRQYIYACSDLNAQIVDSLTAYNGVSSIDTADAVAIALNATRVVREDLNDIKSSQSVTHLPESRTVIRKTAFGS